MTLRLAISGFGRIGRLTTRALQEMKRDDMQIVLINTPSSADIAAHLYEFDSIHGRATSPVTSGLDWIDVGCGKIPITHERDPSKIPHAAHSVDIVLECSGKFNSREGSAGHLVAGAKKVLVSAPCKQADMTVVYGVNHNDLHTKADVVSNASCTTNCLAPVAKVLTDTVGITAGYMTTIHAYTGDQPILDSSHKDMRRARAAAISMIPTSTGATSAVGEVLPALAGKMNGSAIRVPTANVSVVDLVVTTSRDTSLDAINQAFCDAANGALKGVLGINERPLVSIDFNHDPHSSVVDLTQTNVANKRFVRVLSWYDNEWGFSCRMLDTAAAMSNYL